MADKDFDKKFNIDEIVKGAKDCTEKAMCVNALALTTADIIAKGKDRREIEEVCHFLLLLNQNLRTYIYQCKGER